MESLKIDSIDLDAARWKIESSQERPMLPFAQRWGQQVNEQKVTCGRPRQQ